MRIVKEMFICDLCSKEVSKSEYVNVDMLVKFANNHTDGKPCKPYFSRENLGLCRDCINRAVVIEGSGYAGDYAYRFRQD